MDRRHHPPGAVRRAPASHDGLAKIGLCIGLARPTSLFVGLSECTYPRRDDHSPVERSNRGRWRESLCSAEQLFLPVETETHELEEAFPDNLFSVGRECFVVPCGGANRPSQGRSKCFPESRGAQGAGTHTSPTAMATIVVPEPRRCRGKDDTVQKTKSDAASKKELKAPQRRVRRLEKRIAEAELAKKNLEEHAAILQSSVKSLAEAARNQQRGASCYKALPPVLAKMKKTGQDAGALTQGLKVYKMLLELTGKHPSRHWTTLTEHSSGSSPRKIDGNVRRVPYQSGCPQPVPPTVEPRAAPRSTLQREAGHNGRLQAPGTEAVRSTLLEERMKDMDRAYDDGFFQMLTETLSSSMDEEGVTDLPAGMHLLYDAQGLLLGWKRMTKTWAVATPFQGALPNASGGDQDFLMWETTTGADWSVALPEDATFADAEALLVEALGGGGCRVLSRVFWVAHGNVRGGSLRGVDARGGRDYAHPLFAEG